VIENRPLICGIISTFFAGLTAPRQAKERIALAAALRLFSTVSRVIHSVPEGTLRRFPLLSVDSGRLLCRKHEGPGNHPGPFLV